MKVAFAAAFEKWESEYRTNPERFMSRFQMDSTPTATLAERQADCFISYLNELAAGKPWDAIGAK